MEGRERRKREEDGSIDIDNTLYMSIPMNGGRKGLGREGNGLKKLRYQRRGEQKQGRQIFTGELLHCLRVDRRPCPLQSTTSRFRKPRKNTNS